MCYRNNEEIGYFDQCQHNCEDVDYVNSQKDDMNRQHGGGHGGGFGYGGYGHGGGYGYGGYYHPYYYSSPWWWWFFI